MDLAELGSSLSVAPHSESRPNRRPAAAGGRRPASPVDLGDRIAVSGSTFNIPSTRYWRRRLSLLAPTTLMRADILRQLVEAHVHRDDAAFRKATLLLAASEGNAGHSRIAKELRALIAELPTAQSASPALEPSGPGMMVDIAQPRGEVAGLLTGGFSQERLRDVVLAESTRARLERIIQEHVHRADLEGWGVSASRKLLLCGPPGCGKTMTAGVIAGELGLPLMTVRFDGLFSRFLGATANHLKVIFDEMPRRPAVYFFDEFDTVAKSRGDAQDIGEVRRVVTSFLQLMDADRSGSIIIAATNFDELLDRAVFRRFDVILPFALPTAEQLTKLIHVRLRAFDLPKGVAADAAGLGVGLSFADAARACDDAVRTMALARRRELLPADLRNAFILAAERVRPNATSALDA